MAIQIESRSLLINAFDDLACLRRSWARDFMNQNNLCGV